MRLDHRCSWPLEVAALRFRSLLFLAAFLSTVATCSHAAELKMLGTLSTIDPNRYPPVAFGDVLVLSADGRVAAGRDDGSIFYWTAESGMRHVPNFEDYHPTYVHDIYADGSAVLVDMVKNVGAYSFELQALWSPTSGFTPLTNGGNAPALSNDGQVVVGRVSDPAILSPDGIWSELGDLPSVPLGQRQYANGVALDVNADGTTVVGQAGDLYFRGSPYHGEAFRWTAAEGLKGLGFLADHKQSAATSVSADGAVIVGTSGELFDFPFRWTEEGGMKLLDAGPTYRDVIVSGDGKTIAWSGAADGYIKAKIWTAGEGVRWVDDVLTEAGVDLKGFSIAAVYSISHDGRTIGGAAIHEYYRTIAQPYVATLAIPEPSSTALGLAGCLGCAFLSRRRWDDLR